MEAARRAGIRQAAMQEISTAVHIMPMLAIGLANIELFASLSDAHLEQKQWMAEDEELKTNNELTIGSISSILRPTAVNLGRIRVQVS
jgi:hypothetical protein